MLIIWIVVHWFQYTFPMVFAFKRTAKCDHRTRSKQYDLGRYVTSKNQIGITRPRRLYIYENASCTWQKQNTWVFRTWCEHVSWCILLRTRCGCVIIVGEMYKEHYRDGDCWARKGGKSVWWTKAHHIFWSCAC